MSEMSTRIRLIALILVVFMTIELVPAYAVEELKSALSVETTGEETKDIESNFNGENLIEEEVYIVGEAIGKRSINENNSGFQMEAI